MEEGENIHARVASDPTLKW